MKILWTRRGCLIEYRLQGFFYSEHIYITEVWLNKYCYVVEID